MTKVKLTANFALLNYQEKWENKCTDDLSTSHDSELETGDVESICMEGTNILYFKSFGTSELIQRSSSNKQEKTTDNVHF